MTDAAKSSKARVRTTYSILHSPDERIVYVNKISEPAFSSPTEAKEELQRISQKIGTQPKIIEMPNRSGLLNGFIAVWGNVALTPVDAANTTKLADGKSPKLGFMVDFITDFQHSAKTGLPIYRIGGGAGLILAVSYGKPDRGTLRLIAVDASKFSSPRSQNSYRRFLHGVRRLHVVGCMVRYADDYKPGQRRLSVPLSQIPEHVQQAFISVEDKRFYSHKGIDEHGLIRAFVGNLAQPGRPQGGSTITQQVAKNLLVGDDVSYERKIREMIIATRLERVLSKHEILELYLNSIYLGRSAWGVEMAAHVERATELVGRYTLFAQTHKIECNQPLIECDMAPLHHRAQGD